MRDPTADGYIYPHPRNRWEERESFRILRDPDPYTKPKDPEPVYKVLITFDEDNNLQVIGPPEIVYVTKQTSVHGGVYDVNETTGEITVDTDMISGIVDVNKPNLDGGGGIFIVVLYHNLGFILSDDDIYTKLPFGFSSLKPVRDRDKNIIVIIERDNFLYPEEEVNDSGENQ